jgi:hypothetical protein
MAVRFDAGTDVYTATTGLPSSSTVWSMTMWALMAVNRATYCGFLDMPQTTGADAATWQYPGVGGNGTTIIGAFSDATEISSPAVDMTVGTWFRIALIRASATSATLYRGAFGSPLTATTDAAMSTNITGTPAKLWLGGDSYSAEWWNGRLANVKLYNAALTQAEVETELGQYVPVRTANLLRWHPMIGAETTDRSGNGNTLTAGSTAANTEDGPPIPWMVMAAPQPMTARRRAANF